MNVFKPTKTETRPCGVREKGMDHFGVSRREKWIPQRNNNGVYLDGLVIKCSSVT